MLKKLLILLSIFLIFSCENKEKKVEDINTSIDSTAIALPPPSSNKNHKPKETLQNWVNYYQSKVPDFSINNFIKKDTFKVKKLKATTLPSYAKDFDQRYLPLFSYNPNHTKYIDIDSYLLKFDENGNIKNNIDQEIVLVDEKNNEAHRILFYGPSFRVEDAYFKNDSTLVLLENNEDNVPGFQEINLNTMISTAYDYKDTLNFTSNYYQLRVKKTLNETIKP